MSGATAQKIRRAGGNVKSGRGSEEGGNGVRVGQRMSSTPTPQQAALSPAKSASSQAPTTPSSDQETSSEGEISSSSGEERNSRVGTVNRTYPTIGRSHATHSGWGSLVSEENLVKPPVRSLKFSLSSRGRESPEQASNSNNADRVLEDAATVAPALRTLGFSPPSGGGDDQVSLVPISETLPPSRPNATVLSFDGGADNG